MFVPLSSVVSKREDSLMRKTVTEKDLVLRCYFLILRKNGKFITLFFELCQGNLDNVLKPEKSI